MGNLAHKSQYDKLYVIGTGLLSVKNLIKLSIPIGYTCINANKINEEDEWEIINVVLNNFFNFRTEDIVLIESHPKISGAATSLHRILELRDINCIIWSPKDVSSNLEEYIIDRIKRKDFRINRTLV